jgi:hypothetical protein
VEVNAFVWLGQLGRKARMMIAAIVGLVSPKHAAVIRAPGLSLRQPGNITPANSFCAGLGHVGQLPYLYGGSDSLPAANFRRNLYLVLGRPDSRNIFPGPGAADGGNRCGPLAIGHGNLCIVPG